jgi:hypothetical protein
MLAVLLVPLVAAAPVPKAARPALGKMNSNALVKQHRAKLTLDASSQYQGWEVGKAFDGDDETSWFSADGDCRQAGTSPWLRVTFPEDVTVRRVTLLGNREPQWPAGYSITAGTVELLDAAGGVLAKKDLTGAGDKLDFEYTPEAATARVRAVRFTATADAATGNCVAVGEMRVE